MDALLFCCGFQALIRKRICIIRSDQRLSGCGADWIWLFRVSLGLCFQDQPDEKRKNAKLFFLYAVWFFVVLTNFYTTMKVSSNMMLDLNSAVSSGTQALTFPAL